MKKVSVKIPAQPSQYSILFPEDFPVLKAQLKTQLAGRKALYVTDKNVLKETKFFTPKERQKPGKNIVVLAPGEKSKNFDSIDRILKAAFEAGLDRKSVIVAVGGGVVGDMAGFAASIFMRGVPCLQVPTTLLAMVDASIGGKTGIDSEYGKNLIGSIVQPEAVFVCEKFLKSLPDIEIKNGIAEMVKHGIIADKNHFKKLEKLAKKDFKTVRAKIFDLARDSMCIKKKVVEADVKEAGQRQVLNLGHTFGHAIEQASNYRVPHGRAVAIGCVMAAQYAAEKGLCKAKLVDQVENIFNQFEVDLVCKIPEEKLWAAMAFDKKKSGRELTLILPQKIGKVTPFNVTI